VKKYLTIQSNIFIYSAIFILLISLLPIGILSETSALFSFIIIIAIFGVPHGSLDALFAKKALKLITYADWIKFICIYLSISLSVLMLWSTFPTILFVTFLIFSALHFSDDLSDTSTKLTGILYGICIISLPSVLHQDELIKLYSYIINHNNAIQIVYVMQAIAIIASFLIIPIAVLASQEIKGTHNLQVIFEIISVCTLMLIVKPLLAFTIYFCLMHSARHILRSRYYFEDYSNNKIIGYLTIPTIFVIVFCYFILQLLPSEKVDENLIKVTFSGLAALTFPHAYLLHKIKFLAWLNKYTRTYDAKRHRKKPY
jgi:beta-carotene 15,15'-dioxygenase